MGYFPSVTEVPEATLYLWRKQAREQWSSANKFAVVLEAAPLNEAELAAYCRRKGLLVEQLERWRGEIHAALSAGQSRAGVAERATDKKRIRDAEKGLAQQGEGIERNGDIAGAVPKVRSAVDRRRGRMIALPQRQKSVGDIEQACQDGVHVDLWRTGIECVHRRALAPHRRSPGRCKTDGGASRRPRTS